MTGGRPPGYRTRPFLAGIPRLMEKHDREVAALVARIQAHCPEIPADKINEPEPGDCPACRVQMATYFGGDQWCPICEDEDDPGPSAA